jgi:hypothetical protein
MLEALFFAVDMRVAEDEFVATLVADIGNVKHAFFATYLGVKYDMEQDIAEFLAYLLVVILD